MKTRTGGGLVHFIRMESRLRQAFVLGAGLGTRLRPLTQDLPKPLIPVWGRPLMTHGFDHLRTAGVDRFIVNTHWHPEAYDAAFPENTWRGIPITLRHEPILLETAGGVANVADLLGRTESFWVYNGDILSTLPLAPALDSASRLERRLYAHPPKHRRRTRCRLRPDHAAMSATCATCSAPVFR